MTGGEKVLTGLMVLIAGYFAIFAGSMVLAAILSLLGLAA